MGPNFKKYNPRFYREKFPKEGDIVMVVVRSIAGMGVYVSLLEYGDLEGMVLLSELSRRRIRSMNKIVRVGKQEAVVVIRVDQNKSYIDLSKRQVNIDDIRACEDRYMRQKTVIAIMKSAAEALSIDSGEAFESLLDRTVWELDKKYKNLGGSYYAFKACLSDSSIFNELNISQNERDVLHLYIRNRLEPKRMKIRAYIKVYCYIPAGVDAVKQSLSEGFKDNTTENEDNFIKINLVAPPVYVISSTSFDSELCIKHMNEVIKKIEAKILAFGGHFQVEEPPKIVSELEDAELARRMAEFERNNLEIDGDDNSDGEAADEESEDDEEDEEDVADSNIIST